jgi:hypothetical protein
MSFEARRAFVGNIAVSGHDIEALEHLCPSVLPALGKLKVQYNTMERTNAASGYPKQPYSLRNVRSDIIEDIAIALLFSGQEVELNELVAALGLDDNMVASTLVSNVTQRAMTLGLLEG